MTQVRPSLTFQQLTSRYWGRSGSLPFPLAKGALHGIFSVDDFKKVPWNSVVAFLEEIGDEVTKRETEKELRHEARVILARRVLESTMMAISLSFGKPFTDKQYPVVDLIKFYAAHVEHSNVPERDRAEIHKFLQNCLGRTCPEDLTTPLRSACVNSQAIEIMIGYSMFDVVPLLYEKLRKAHADIPSIGYGVTKEKFPDLECESWTQLPESTESNCFMLDASQQQEAGRLLHNHASLFERDMRKCLYVCGCIIVYQKKDNASATLKELMHRALERFERYRTVFSPKN